jgi:uncharacterized cupin superfamily protein
MAPPPRPSFILATNAIAERPVRYPGSPEVFSYTRAIGQRAGLQRIGLHVQRLPPGHRTSYPHAEEDEEEFVLLLDGNADAWLDGELHPMNPGDLVAFPAGTGISHCIINNSDEDALLLVGGERGKPSSRIFYPLNPARRDQLPEGAWWEDVPAQPLGPHDGLPTKPPGGAAG